MPEQMTPDEFGAKIKAKYPAYANLSNIEIANKVVAKYPQYKDSIKAPTETPITPPSLYEQFSKPVSAIGHAAHPIQANLADVGRGAINAVGTFAQHPIQTLSASGQMLGDLMTVAFPNGQPDEKLTASRGRLREQLSAAKEHPAFTVGQLAAGELGGEALARGVGKVVEGVPKVARRGAEIATKTGPGETANLVKETQKANVGITEANRKAGEEHLGKTQEALHETAGRELKHQQDVKAANETAQKAQTQADAEHFEAVQKALEETRQREELHQGELRKARAEGEEAYQKKVAEVQQKNAAAEEARKAELRSYFEKTKDLKNARERGQDALDRKVALTRGVEQLDPEIKGELEKEEIRVNQEANRYYNDLRKVLKDEKAAPYQPVDEEGNIFGSPQTITEHLHDVATTPLRGTETEPAIIKSLGDRVKHGETTMTYNDLQGYREEAGRELRKGSLPPDTFTSYKNLLSAIDDSMAEIAARRGLEKAQGEARAYYRRYAETFLDRTSPIRKALDMAEHGQTIRQFQGKDISGVEQLAQFNPQLARRINTIRGLQSEATGIRPKAVTGREPTLGEKPEPIPLPQRTEPQIAPPARVPIPERPKPVEAKSVPAPERVSPPDRPIETPTKKVNMADIREAKAKGAENRTSLIEHRGTWVAAWPLFHIMSQIVHGDVVSLPADIAASGATYAGVQGVAAILRRPIVTDFLTRATARDIAQVPADLRGDLPTIISTAQKNGIRVSPALLGAVMGSRNYPLGPNTKRLKAKSDELRANSQP